MPEINTLKEAVTPASRLYNWKVISRSLEAFNIMIHPDTKSLIIAGDTDMVVEVLSLIYDAERLGFPSTTPTKAKATGVVVEEVQQEKELTDSESCVEYFVLSFCHNFSLNPKQGAGLLVQGSKYLAHIIAKGLKSNFEPIKLWLQEIYSTTEYLSELVFQEHQSGSIDFVLSALKPGLLSKDLEVVHWTLRVLSRLVLDLTEKNLFEEVWKWFTHASVIEVCTNTLKRMENELYNTVIDLILQIGQYDYFELFTLHLRNVLTDTKDYIDTVCAFVLQIDESESISEDIRTSGIIPYWVQQALKEAEAGPGRSPDNRVSGLCLLVKLVYTFTSTIEESENSMASILALINRTCRDENELLRNISIGMMFYLFEFLMNANSAYGPILYRTLTFLLVETYSTVATREYMLNNFIIIFKNSRDIPVNTLLDPYIKRLQVLETSLEIFDYDFLSAVSQYPLLPLKLAIQLIDLIGKYYLNEIANSKASGVPFTYLASRFIEEQPMQEYLYMFSQYSLNLAISTDQIKYKSNVKPDDYEEKIQQRNRILDMISWIIQQWQDNLNERLKSLLLQSNYDYYQNSSFQSKGIIVVLELFGVPDELLKDFQDSNPALFPLTPDKNYESQKNIEKNLKNYQIANIVDKKDTKKKIQFPWERIEKEIEKAKQKKIEKDNKIKSEELKIQKALQYKKNKIKKQLQLRKIEQGVGREDISLVYKEGTVEKYIINPEQIILKEFSSAESDLQESVKLMISKYSRVFKFLFSKYSGTGFEKKNHNKSDFELLAERKSKLNDAECIKLLKDFNIIPKLLNKEELRGIMRTYNHQVAKQAEQSYVGYKGFKDVFCQVAFFIYSRKPLDYSHLPPVVSLKVLLNYMRDYLKAQGKNTELFDEPDPGTGDKDVVRSLNKLLQKNPKAPIPEGYEKIEDKEVQVFFYVPNNLKIPISYKYSIEILSDILADIGIIILEPQIEYSTTYRIKGIAPVKQKIELPPIHERNLSLPKKLSKEPLPLLPNKYGKLSPFLKLKLASIPPKNKELYEECAYLLEDILHSVKLKMKRVINRQPKGGAQNEKLESIKQRLKQEEENKKIEEDKKRIERQSKLIKQLTIAKEKRQQWLMEEDEKKRYLAQEEEAYRKENEEKIREKKEEMKKKLEEWAQKRKENNDKSIEEKKRKQAEEIAKIEEIKKKNEEKLDTFIKQKTMKIQEQKKIEERKNFKEKIEQDKKKELGLKSYLEKKIKDENKNQKKAENFKLFSNNDIKAYLSKFSDQIGEIFIHYVNQTDPNLNSDISINLTAFKKFCTDFSLNTLISEEQTTQVFNFITKKKTIASLTDDEFEKALILISNNSKDILGVNESGLEPLKKLFDILKISVPLKDLKKKLKSLKEHKKKPKSYKKKLTHTLTQNLPDKFSENSKSTPLHSRGPSPIKDLKPDSSLKEYEKSKQTALNRGGPSPIKDFDEYSSLKEDISESSSIQEN